jgi:hypothetical protein
MALHNLVYDCAVKAANLLLPIAEHSPVVKQIELTAEEEAQELARWAANEARQALEIEAKKAVVSIEDRIKALEAKVGIT